MNERLLDALMELFAIIANIDIITEKGREVVKVFLRQQISLNAVDEYLKLYDHYAEKHAEIGKSRKKKDGKKRTSVGQSVKALVICQQINAELTQKQKIVVLIRILEFVKSDSSLTDEEDDFVTTMALAFNFEENEYLNIKDYVLNQDFDALAQNSSNVLLIDQNHRAPKSIQHYHTENLKGQLCFLKIPSVDIYVVKYKGEDELTLNGQPVLPHQIYILANGSAIRSPKISPIYYSDIVGHFLADVNREKIIFRAKNVEFRFKSGKSALNDINITEESGRLIGFMGASGAGKTTLLNVLSGIESPTEGRVTINGVDIHKEKGKIQGVVGYVSQDDLLIEELTVFQNLYYNAKLCFGSLSDDEIKALVEKTLESLGLAESQHLQVGSPLDKKISGGQRKRLNIALELIREPVVLFVDEPTSGLSSRDSENIMDLLKELSLKGKLIFVVIHQPSSDIYKMFDKLLILDVGGYPVYYGHPIEAVAYFREITNHVHAEKTECSECGNVNPEQIFNIIEAKVVDEYGNFTNQRKINPQQWYEFYKKNILIPVKKRIKQIPTSTLKIPSHLRQLQVFLTRDILSKISNTQYLLITFMVAPLLAFILAVFVRYYEADDAVESFYIFSANPNLPPYLFMSVVVALFIGLTLSAEEIIKDRKIRKRESFLNLSRSSYLFSKVIILLVISALQMLTFVIIGNSILKIEGMTWSYWLVLFSTAFFANMLGLNISSAFKSAVTIYILIPILLIPQLLLSGAVVKFDELNPEITAETHVPLVGDLMASKWAFEALAVNQFKNNEYEKPFYDYEKKMSEASFVNTFMLDRLSSKIDIIERNIGSEANSKEAKEAAALIKKELPPLMRKAGLTEFNLENINLAEAESYSINELRALLEKLRKVFAQQYNKASALKNKEIASKDEKELLRLKQNHHNEEIAALVTNKHTVTHIIESNGKLIQKIDPVYLDPKNYKNAFDFRSHFFAPRKHFFDRYYPTLPFNVIILWAMSLLLFIALYFEWLRKLVEFFGNIPEFLANRRGKQP